MLLVAHTSRRCGRSRKPTTALSSSLTTPTSERRGAAVGGDLLDLVDEDQHPLHPGERREGLRQAARPRRSRSVGQPGREQLDERPAEPAGDGAGEGRLAGAGRAEEHDGPRLAHPVLLGERRAATAAARSDARSATSPRSCPAPAATGSTAGRRRRGRRPRRRPPAGRAPPCRTRRCRCARRSRSCAAPATRSRPAGSAQVSRRAPAATSRCSSATSRSLPRPRLRQSGCRVIRRTQPRSWSIRPTRSRPAARRLPPQRPARRATRLATTSDSGNSARCPTVVESASSATACSRSASVRSRRCQGAVGPEVVMVITVGRVRRRRSAR